jgi:hypothetical protein
MGQNQGEITRQRKLAIIDILIQYQETDSTELINSIPDIWSMRNPSAALTEPIKELREERIIPKKRKRIEHKKGVKGAIPLHLKIINNSKTIRAIFESYPIFRTDLYDSDWVRETMVKDRITFPLSDESKEELKRYLHASPSFFRYFLIHDNIDEIAVEWTWHVYANILEVMDYSLAVRNYRDGKDPFPPKAFHELFYLCAFVDRLNGEMTPDARKFVETYERIGKKKSIRR